MNAPTEHSNKLVTSMVANQLPLASWRQPSLWDLSAPASANGATNTRNRLPDDIGACTDPGRRREPDFATIMTGDLEGCQYVFVEPIVVRQVVSMQAREVKSTWSKGQTMKSAPCQ